MFIQKFSEKVLICQENVYNFMNLYAKTQFCKVDINKREPKICSKVKKKSKFLGPLQKFSLYGKLIEGKSAYNSTSVHDMFSIHINNMNVDSS